MATTLAMPRQAVRALHLSNRDHNLCCVKLYCRNDNIVLSYTSDFNWSLIIATVEFFEVSTQQKQLENFALLST